jgi:hypothetical protein
MIPRTTGTSRALDSIDRADGLSAWLAGPVTRRRELAFGSNQLLAKVQYALRY